MGEIGVVNSNGAVSGWKCFPPPDPTSFSEECLLAAEEAAEQVLNCVHPTLDSEEKRRDVIDYVQQLVQTHLNCEVVSYGSVPLKTYLPDGDIDLTVLTGPNAGESLAHDVLTLLQGEEKKKNAEYQVKDTQFIDAEVKLVKCFVRNFVIDLSFNQLGGLSTLCFLEQVDRLVGRNHLFKRSIILIKTWCYYESRILGAHHGLISTYALETLVLYIFQNFHSALTGPLSALYRFLDYFSQFDWENYCISLKGPVCKSLLPDIVVRMPEGGWNDPLLSEDFLGNCLELFSVPSRGLEANAKAFQTKHLNIIDPLKENNNLGRSVHRGNFYRIQSAFKYGAHKLGQVLLRPKDKVVDEVFKFFANTRAHHETQYKSTNRRLALELGDDESLTESLSSPVDFSSEEDMLLKSPVSDFDDISVDVGQPPILDFKNELDSFSLVTSNSRNGTSESSNYSASLSENHFHKQIYLSSKSSTETVSSEANQFDPAYDSEKLGSSSWSENRDKLMEMDDSDFREIDSTSVGGESEAFNPLADLSGDYDGNIRSLLRGQLCHGFASSSLSRVRNNKPWDVIPQSMPLRVNESSQMNPHTLSDLSLPGNNTLHFDGKQKARGTGTYLPQMNFFCMDTPSHGRGRNKAPSNHNQFHKYGHNNGLYPASESNTFENSGHDVVPERRKYNGRKRRSDVRSQPHRSVGGGNQMNSYLSASSCRIEFGSIGNLADEVISGSAHVRGPTLNSASLKPQGSTGVMMRQRVAGQSIHIKNEDEFPPLCQ